MAMKDKNNCIKKRTTSNKNIFVWIFIFVMLLFLIEGISASWQYNWSNRTDIYSKPAGIFNQTPFPLDENTVSYNITNDEGVHNYYLGTKYFVNASMADDSGNGLTLATAKKTISAAITAAGAGNNIILVTNGTYYVNGVSYTLKGGLNETNRWILSGYKQDRPVIVGNISDNLIKIRDSYVTIQRLKIQDSRYEGLAADGRNTSANVIDVWVYNTTNYVNITGDGNIHINQFDNVLVSHVLSEHTYDHCIKIGDNDSNAVVEWSVARECGYWSGIPNVTDGTAVGFDFPSDLPQRPFNMTLRYSIANTTLFDCLQIREQSNYSIHHNEFYNCPNMDGISGERSHATYEGMVIISKSSYGTFYNNLFHDGPDGEGTAGSTCTDCPSVGLSLQVNSTNVSNFYNNIFYNITTPLVVYGFNGDGLNQYYNFSSNSIYGNSNDTLVRMESGTVTPGEDAVTFRNNIVYQNGSNSTNSRCANFDTDIIHQYNLYYAPNAATGVTLGTGEINANPLWQAIPLGGSFNVNYTGLTANSPAINNGTSLPSQFAFDFHNTFRPQGSGWDIGAYEYSNTVNNCTTLSTANTIYTLINNVNSSGTCFTINAQNITLDCNNYIINYSQGGTANTYGIYTNQINTTVKNCNIYDGNITNTNTDRPGIYYYTVSQGTIENNNLSTWNGIGIYLSSSSNNTLTSNTGTSKSLQGILLYSSLNNTLTSNMGISNSSSGIRLASSSNYNILTNNTGTSNASYGIYLESSSNNNLTSNTGTSNASSGIHIGTSSNNTLTYNTGISNVYVGIAIQSSSNNTLTNNTGISNALVGIYLESSSNNTLTNNTGISNISQGIRLTSSSNNNILINNTGISNASMGIYLSSSSNKNLTSNTGTSNASYGIYLASSSNNTLTSNIGISNSSMGIYLDTSSNDTLTYNTGISNISQGIRLSTSSNNTLTSNIGISNTSHGIYLYSSSNNNILTNNTGTTDSGTGIYLESSSNNNILTNNTGISNSGSNPFGIRLSSSSNNTLTSNTGISNSSYGILFQTSNNNTLTNNTGISNSSVATYLQLSTGNSFYNHRTEGRLAGGYGIYFEGTNNTLLQDCVNISGVAGDVLYSSSASSVNNTFINCSYNTSKEIVQGAGNYLTRIWYYRAYVNDTNNNPVNNINVTALNSTNNYQFNLTTNSSGYTALGQIIDYVNNGTRYYYSNYNITATNTTSIASHLYNVTTNLNNLKDVFTLNVSAGGGACTGNFTRVNSTYVQVCSCNYTAVNESVNNATSGNTVYVPAGNCMWNNTLIITKAITLQGAGSNYTHISSTVNDTYTSLVSITLSSNVPVRITNIHFNYSTNYIGARSIQINGKTDNSFAYTQIRIDHNKFEKGTRAIFSSGRVEGVIDQNEFVNNNIGVGISGEDNHAWNRTISAGTSHALFIENNTFWIDNNTNQEPNEAIYPQTGARTVVRYNLCNTTQFTTLSNFQWHTSHGNQDYYNLSNGGYDAFRGQPILESYGNIVAFYHSYSPFYSMRGGSVIIYNETITYAYGSNPGAIRLTEEEDWQGAFFNPLRTVWPAEDQVMNSFIWNVSVNGAPISDVILGTSNDSTFIQQNRDYFMHAPNATGGREYYTNRSGAAGTYPTDGSYIFNYSGTMNFSSSVANAYYPYIPYYYPHPLVSGIPGVNLDAPVTSYLTSYSTNQTSITFNVSAIDSSALANVTLYGNWTGTWQANQTIALTGTSNSTNFTKTLANGTYIWNAYVCDNENNCRFGVQNYTLSVGTLGGGGAGANNTYYVDFSTGDDTNNGISTSTPWKHAPGDTNYTGSGTLHSNDTVIFKRGITYYGMITTLSNGVNYTVTDWGTGDAIINGSGNDAVFQVQHNNITIDGGSNRNLVITGNINHAGIWNYNDSTNLSGSTFTNLNISFIGSASSDEGVGIKIGGNNNAYTNYVISNNYISYVYSSAIKISGSGTKNINIVNNIIENSGDKAGEDTQINLSSNAGEGVQNATVHNNTIRNSAGNANGINVNNANNSIYDNLIYNNGGYGMSLSPDYNTNYNGVIYVYLNKIYNNVNNGIIIGTSSALRYAQIYNNLIYNNSVAEINLLSSSSNNLIFSNSIYTNFTGSGIRVQIGSNATTIKNNIIRTNNGYVIYADTSNLTENYNCIYRTGGVDWIVWNGSLYSSLTTYRTQTNQGANSMWQDCNFTDPQNGNFQLSSTSPAINNGTDLSAYFTTDFLGVSRPQGSGWDIGAYEYVSNDSVLCESNTYYIDFVNGVDSNNGTCTNSAWKHAPGDSNAIGIPAAATIQSGNKIIFKGGVTYEGMIQINSSIYQNGNSTDKIILRSGDRDTPAWGTGRAVINGKNTRGKGFHISSARNFVTIDGFEIMNMTNQTDSAGIFIDYGSSSDLHILNNLIHHIYGQAGSSGYGIETSGLNKNFIIEFNEIYFVEEKAIELYATTNTTVRYNYLHQTNDHNMVVSGANNSIYGNLLTQAGYDWDGGGAIIPAYSFKVDSGSTPGYDYADYNNIYNNIIWDTTTGFGILNGKYNNFSNNVVYYVGFDDLNDISGGNEGFTLYNDGTSTNSVTGNKITNNIFYYITLWSTGDGPIYPVGFSFRNQTTVTNNEVKNNLFYYNSSQIDFVRFSDSGAGYPYTYHNISWFESASGFASVGTGNNASNNIVLNPNFSGGSGASILSSVPTWFDSQGHPNNTGFMLNASSPAIDAGLALSPPFNIDVNGVTRPQGPGWDIGAYEYNSTSNNTYYIDLAATGSNNGSDWTNAWTNFSKINWTLIQPGNTIYIKGGTYNESVDVASSGSSGNYITFASYANETVIINGKAGDYAFRIYNRDYIKINGSGQDNGNHFVFRNASDCIQIRSSDYTWITHVNATESLEFNGLKILSDNPGTDNSGTDDNSGSKYCIIENSSFYSNGDYGIKVTGWNTSYNIFRYNTFFNNGLCLCGSMYGLSVSGDGYDANVPNHNEYYGNKFYGNIANGMNSLKTTKNIIRNNEFYSNGLNGENGAGLGLSEESDNNLVYQNKFYNNSHYGISLYGGSSNKIYNNLIYNNTDVGIRVQYGASNNEIYSNTIDGRAYNAIYVASNSSNTTIKNNILSNTGGNPDLYVVGTTPIASDYNLFYRFSGSTSAVYYNSTSYTLAQFTAATGNDSHSIQANPQFVDYINYNYHLQSGSPAIDNGTNLSVFFTTDFANITRPIDGDNNGSAEWDIGAYEYQSISNVTVTLNSPANGNSTNNATVIFNCSAVSNTNLTNMTLYGNWTGAWQANQTINISGTSNSTTFTKNLTSGTYIWNCLAYDNNSNYDWGNSNFTLTVDTIAPQISIIYPTNNTNTTNTQINVNYTVSDANLQSCWYSNATGAGAVNYTLTNCVNITGRTWLEGINNVTVWVNDTAGNQNYSRVTFTVDTIAPNIQIVYPSNNTNTTNIQINVNYTVSDSGTGIGSCWYTNTSGAVNYTLVSCANITGRTWLQGINNVSIYVNDTTGNVGSSSVRFTVDTIAPYFTNLANQSLLQGQSLNYDINATDDGVGLGTFAINWTTNFSIVASTGVLTSNSGLNLGMYYINVSVNDTIGNLNSSILLVNVSADTTAPNVNLISPTNSSTWSSSSTVTFTYNVTDNNDITNCSLIINGTFDQVNSSAVVKNISQTFTKSLSNANYNWSVNCTDLANNQGNSSINSLTVSYTAPSGGGTPSGGGGGGAATKPSNETISNATGEAGGNISITKIIPTMTVENTTIIKDINALFGVKEIQITVNNEVKDVEVTIVRYYEKPSQVPIIESDNVYSYLQIYTKNLTSFEKGVITIQVEKDWISLENIARDDISLFQFNESSGKWNELVTNYTQEDDKYYYYQSEVNSFSYFYIGEKVLEREKIADRLKDVISRIKNFFNEILIVLNNLLSKFVETVKPYWEIAKPYQLYIFIGFGGIFVLIALIIIVRRVKNRRGRKREKIIKHRKNHVEKEIKRNQINHKKAEKNIRKQIKKKNRRENRKKRKVIKRQEKIIKRRKKVVEREIKRHSKATKKELKRIGKKKKLREISKKMIEEVRNYK